MNGWDRREGPRAAIIADAQVTRGDDVLGTYPVIDLSVNGARLGGGPNLHKGERVALTLLLADGQRLRIDASVVRTGGDQTGRTVAFAFAGLDGATEAALDKVVWQQLIESRAARVLIVEESALIARELRFQLRCLGLGCQTVRTPLEAIQTLSAPHGFSIVLVGRGSKPAAALELLAFMNESHPAVRSALVSGLEALLPKRPEGGARPGVTSRPWSMATLARLIDL